MSAKCNSWENIHRDKWECCKMLRYLYIKIGFAVRFLTAKSIINEQQCLCGPAGSPGHGGPPPRSLACSQGHREITAPAKNFRNLSPPSFFFAAERSLSCHLPPLESKILYLVSQTATRDLSSWDTHNTHTHTHLRTFPLRGFKSPCV
jgi:hypothetical protein